MRAVGVNTLLQKTFDVYPFEGRWYDSFAQPEKNFSMIVYGKPGNGKTEFCIQMAKYMAKFTKVYYNSFEQGVSKSLQDAAVRNKLQDVSGKLIFGDKESFEEMKIRLSRRNAPQVIFIDSRDYMNMTASQYKELREANKRKSFVIICWESGGKPKGEYAKAIEYMVDIKVHVTGFKAKPRCRFGGNQDFIIWNRPKRKLGGLFINQES